MNDAEIQAALRQLPDWQVVDGKLHREFAFADFNEAFGFMARGALAAEQMDHHPEWFNVWSRVVIDLTTHDVGGLSRKDFELAERMNRIANS